MKKLSVLALLFAVLMLCSLVGCGGQEASNADPHAGHNHATAPDSTAQTTDSTANHSHATTTPTSKTQANTATQTDHSHATTSKGDGQTDPDKDWAFDDIVSLAVVDKIPAGARAFKDPSVEEVNYTLELTAITNLAQIQLISLNPDTSMPEKTLHTFTGLKKGESQYLLTYINDANPNRGIICTDAHGQKWHFAFLYSGKSGRVYLGAFNPKA